MATALTGLSIFITWLLSVLYNPFITTCREQKKQLKAKCTFSKYLLEDLGIIHKGTNRNMGVTNIPTKRNIEKLFFGLRFIYLPTSNFSYSAASLVCNTDGT